MSLYLGELISGIISLLANRWAYNLEDLQCITGGLKVGLHGKLWPDGPLGLCADYGVICISVY